MAFAFGGQGSRNSEGNATKPETKAAAKERWGADLGEDEADIAWTGAFALNAGLFTWRESSCSEQIGQSE